MREKVLKNSELLALLKKGTISNNEEALLFFHNSDDVVADEYNGVEIVDIRIYLTDRKDSCEIYGERLSDEEYAPLEEQNIRFYTADGNECLDFDDLIRDIQTEALNELDVYSFNKCREFHCLGKLYAVAECTAICNADLEEENPENFRQNALFLVMFDDGCKYEFVYFCEDIPNNEEEFKELLTSDCCESDYEVLASVEKREA